MACDDRYQQIYDSIHAIENAKVAYEKELRRQSELREKEKIKKRLEEERRQRKAALAAAEGNKTPPSDSIDIRDRSSSALSTTSTTSTPTKPEVVAEMEITASAKAMASAVPRELLERTKLTPKTNSLMEPLLDGRGFDGRTPPPLPVDGLSTSKGTCPCPCCSVS